MNFFLTIMGQLGGWLVQLAPAFFAFYAGKKKTQYDYEEDLVKVLREDNEELRKTAVMPDAAIADSLRDRAAKKRKDQD